MQLLHAVMHATNASLQNHVAGGMALCKMTNAESCLMKYKVLVRFCICVVFLHLKNNKILHGVRELKLYALNVGKCKMRFY